MDQVIERTPVTTVFNQTQRQQIEATILSDPPQWADRYRYFIKDTSMDHHNLICYNVYNDGGVDDDTSEFVWLEFQSTDRNKVFDETSAADGSTATVLTLRRINDEVQTSKQRFLVQEIENEAPTDIRRQIAQVQTNVSVGRVGSFSHANYDLADNDGTTVRRTVSSGANDIYLRDTNRSGSTSNFRYYVICFQ